MANAEFRVRPVVRYAVTRYYAADETMNASSNVLGEFDNEAYANEVANAMDAVEAQRSRYETHIHQDGLIRASQTQTRTAHYVSSPTGDPKASLLSAMRDHGVPEEKISALSGRILYEFGLPI